MRRFRRTFVFFEIPRQQRCFRIARGPEAMRLAIKRRDSSERALRMDQSAIVVSLRNHEAELRAAGVEHLSLHGSCARGTPIDRVPDAYVIADFDRAKKMSLIGRAHLENLLTDILGVQADLADRAMLRPEVLDAALRESVLVLKDPAPTAVWRHIGCHCVDRAIYVRDGL